jgi:hypothetical protein
MTLPNPLKLRSIITSDTALSSASLATRIVVGRLRIEVRNNPALIDAKVQELVTFARQNAFAADELVQL